MGSNEKLRANIDPFVRRVKVASPIPRDEQVMALWEWCVDRWEGPRAIGLLYI